MVFIQVRGKIAQGKQRVRFIDSSWHLDKTRDAKKVDETDSLIDNKLLCYCVITVQADRCLLWCGCHF